MFTKQNIKFTGKLCLQNKSLQTSYVYKTKQYETESLQTRYIYKTKMYRQVMFTKLKFINTLCLQNKIQNRKFTNTLCL